MHQSTKGFNLCMLGNFSAFFFHLLIFFFKINLWNTIRVLNDLEQDQALHFDGPDQGPNCLQMLSTEDKSPLTGQS